VSAVVVAGNRSACGLADDGWLSTLCLLLGTAASNCWAWCRSDQLSPEQHGGACELQDMPADHTSQRKGCLNHAMADAAGCPGG